MTSAVDGGEWSALRPGRSLPQRKDPQVPIKLEAGWASKLVWTQRDRTAVVQFVLRHYTD
jgi:hypothetical protein